MDLQLVVVIALVVLSAAYLGYRLFGSIGSRGETTSGCSGCSAASSCGIRAAGRAPAHRRDDACPDERPAADGIN